MTLRSNSAFRGSWAFRSIASTATVVVVSMLFGFIVFPFLQPDLKIASLWDAICSAAGIARGPTSATPIAPAFSISSVVVTPQMLDKSDSQSIGRGATLAHQCAICHDAPAESSIGAPNLIGQYASTIYKELNDFKSDARSNEIMTPLAGALSDENMADVARYYASLSRPSSNAAGVAAPVIAINGAPLRNIPPCGACHGAIDHKVTTPRLEGQPAAYIKAQLQAFAKGERHNDISQQMRNIARQMTPEEIDNVVQYYSSQP